MHDKVAHYIIKASFYINNVTEVTLEKILILSVLVNIVSIFVIVFLFKTRNSITKESIPSAREICPVCGMWLKKLNDSLKYCINGDCNYEEPVKLSYCNPL